MVDRTSTDKDTKDVVLARWFDRFIAWLIDFIIVTVGILIIYTSFFSASSILYSESFRVGSQESSFDISFNFLFFNLVFFFYWFYFESTSGQSIGKRVMNLKTTDLEGRTAKRKKDIAIESFGKSFLLPLDVLLGWIFTNDKRQRLFNRIGNTIVIKIKKDFQDVNYRYIKD